MWIETHDERFINADKLASITSNVVVMLTEHLYIVSMVLV